MAKFKKGDKVVALRDCSSNKYRKGDILYVIQDNSYCPNLSKEKDGEFITCEYEVYLELYQEQKPEFKAGDRIRWLCYTNLYDDYYNWTKFKVGDVGQVIDVRYNNPYICINGLNHLVSDGDKLELVEELTAQPQKDYSFSLKPELTNNKTIMSNLITIFKNITRSEPNKTFVKAGVMNEDLSLTNEGQQLFIQYLFDTYADEFKTKVVDKIVAEQEKK